MSLDGQLLELIYAKTPDPRRGQELLSQRANPNADLGDGRTVLMEAASKGHRNLVEALLDAGAKIDAKDWKGRTALFVALDDGRNRKDVVGLLVTKRADCNVVAEDGGRFPLGMAAASGDWQLYEPLLAGGANIDATSAGGDTALIMACHGNGAKEGVPVLLQHRANVNIVGYMGKTALLEAAGAQDRELVELLVSHNADLQAVNALGKDALISAATTCNKEVIELLASTGQLDTTRADNDGRTALMHASCSVYAKARPRAKAAVELLISMKSDVNASSKTGTTAIMLAAALTQADVVAALLAAGANVNAADVNGDAALLHVARVEDAKVDDILTTARVLLVQGANVSHKNADGKTARDFASSRKWQGRNKLVEMLDKHSRGESIDESPQCGGVCVCF